MTQIKINKSDKLITNTLRAAIKSNLNPKFINVYLGGGIRNAGNKTVNKEGSTSKTPLITAAFTPWEPEVTIECPS